MEATLYNQKGTSAGTVTLPESVFGLPWNADLVHQVVTSMRSNARAGTADSRGRGEVRGGGRKPWKQKGTGRARHGSTRSPIWKGGGVTHGPLAEKNYTRKINKKMKAKALFTVLSEKNRRGQILFLESLSLPESKTKNAVGIMKVLAGIKGYEKMNYKKANTIFMTLPGANTSIEKGFRNISNLTLANVADLNPLDVLNHRYIVMADPKESIKKIEAKIKDAPGKAKKKAKAESK